LEEVSATYRPVDVAIGDAPTRRLSFTNRSSNTASSSVCSPDTPLGKATVERETRRASVQRADAMHHALNGTGSARKPKPFAEQPVDSRRRGQRPNDSVDDALNRARDHLGNGNA
jgi:hypothetical protein